MTVLGVIGKRHRVHQLKHRSGHTAVLDQQQILPAGLVGVGAGASLSLGSELGQLIGKRSRIQLSQSGQQPVPILGVESHRVGHELAANLLIVLLRLAPLLRR